MDSLFDLQIVRSRDVPNYVMHSLKNKEREREREREIGRQRDTER